MKPKHRRLTFVAFALAALGIAAVLVVSALDDSLLYFYTPSQAAERALDPGTNFRLGGVVAADSVSRDGDTTYFTVTDFEQTIRVSFVGVLPDLFREGQGVIADGTVGGDGVFVAAQVLAKHDETYMPKEVADALKKQGVWQDGSPPPHQ